MGATVQGKLQSRQLAALKSERIIMGGLSERSSVMFAGNSLDRVDRYGGQTMVFQVLNERINHLLEEAVERPIFDVSQPSSHLTQRDLAANDTPANVIEDAPKVFSQYPIGAISWTT